MENNWIKISEQLPPVGSTVLTYPHFKVLPFGNTEEDGLHYDWSDSDFWDWSDIHTTYQKVKPYPTHWMSLPEPPNDDEK